MTLRNRAGGEAARRSEARTCRSTNNGRPYLFHSAKSCTYCLQLPSEATLHHLERGPNFAQDCRAANHSSALLRLDHLSIILKSCAFQANLRLPIFHEGIPDEASAQILGHQN